MIHLQISHCKDELALGTYEYEFDHVHIGRSKKNDLIFLDQELPQLYLMLKIVADGKNEHLVIQSLTDKPYFFVNNKKVLGTLKLRIGDEIGFGQNKIKILNFKKSWPESDLSPYYEEFENKSSTLRYALDFIEEILVDIEENKKNVKN